MATIEENNNSMTIYYSKSTGAIKSLATGIQNMSFFAEDEADYSVIWDYVVLTRDDYVLKNPSQFKINLDTKALEIIAGSIPNYPVAES